MTRNREVRLQDITECTHELEIPVADDYGIVYWRCRCGRRRVPTEDLESDD